jgi:hypothetical protein
MSVFHRLLLGKGTKPLRLVSWPTVIPLQVPDWQKAELPRANATKTTTIDWILRILFMGFPFSLGRKQRPEPRNERVVGATAHRASTKKDYSHVVWSVKNARAFEHKPYPQLRRVNELRRLR